MWGGPFFYSIYQFCGIVLNMIRVPNTTLKRSFIKKTEPLLSKSLHFSEGERYKENGFTVVCVSMCCCGSREAEGRGTSTESQSEESEERVPITGEGNVYPTPVLKNTQKADELYYKNHGATSSKQASCYHLDKTSVNLQLPQSHLCHPGPQIQMPFYNHFRVLFYHPTFPLIKLGFF